MIPLWLVYVIVIVGTAAYLRYAWKRVAEEERLEALHGKPSPYFWEDR